MNKKRGKKLIILLICLLAAGAGGVYGVRYLLQNRNKEVEVVAVKEVNGGDWLMMDYGSQVTGTVVSDVSQQVYVPEDRVIKDVYVAEGDKVRIGDKLVTYDTTLLELDKELQELTVQEIELELKAAQADLAKLRNTTPVERSPEEEAMMSGSLLDELDSEDQARVVNGGRAMTASQESSAAEKTVDASVDAGTNSSNTEIAQTEAPQTEAPQTEAPQTEAPQTEAPQTEAPQTETPQTEAPQTEIPQTPGTETETEQGTDVSDNLTPDDLENATGDVETESEEVSEGESEDPEKPKLNQSLKKFLWYVRAKEVTEAEEITLTETKEENGTDFVIQLSENNIKLIPHFKENADIQFKEANTYTMWIKGVTLLEKRTGKLVGTSNIDGTDYPEIGGFTLEMDPKYESGDVAKLTLMFHGGLTEQQNRGTLQDAYVEIELNASEITGDELIFRVSKKDADDTVIRVEKPQEESQTESESESQSETVTETPTETETETQLETNPPQPIERLDVKIIWYHGTNEDLLWPTSMNLNIYRSDDEEQTNPIVTIENITGDRDVVEDGSENETDTIPETDEISEESEESTEEIGTPETEPSGKPESELDNSYSKVIWNAVREWPAEYMDIEDPEKELRAVVLEENYIPTYTWSREGSRLHLTIKMTYLEPDESPIVKLNPHEKLDYYSGAKGKYYKGTGTAEGSRLHLTIKMTYLEPDESPIVKLNPHEKLDYYSGAKGKYYKGTGTADDPYVFFVKDGVRIENTFVNWVLGFDEAGTTRLNDGCYVTLEIRESDTITGAFIRSVGLDGTILTEYGFGPGTYWIFSSDSGIVRYEEDIPENLGDGGNGGWDDGLGDGIWDDDMDMSYTAEELAQAIKEKEREIRKLNLDEKEARLKLKQYEDQMAESTVVSSVNGFVKSMNDDTKSGDAYMVLASEGGLYLQTTVSELDLDNVEKGDTLTATSWDTMRMFSATVTEINHFPTSTQGDPWSGNVNNSSYPVLAYIDDTSGLSPYEYVGVTFDKKQQASGAIYLPKAYVRSENGQSYVYKRGEDGRLKKQYVRTGETLYEYVNIKEGVIYLPKAYVRSENGQSYVYKRGEDGRLKKQYVRTGETLYEYVNIKEGVTMEDMIAFPYGKNVKEGARTAEMEEEIIY